MIADTIRFLKLTRQTLTSNETTRRMALGVVFGMMIGLIPKDSLFVWVLGVLMIITTANLVSAIVSGLLFCWIGYLLDPFTHKLGGLLLTADGLEPTWNWLYGLPVMPWTRFNNTVVLGSLLLGIVMAIPVYLIAKRFFETGGVHVHNRMKTTWIYRWMVSPASHPVVEEIR
jgi:uncharacterized protein (TIGR03546 family)